MEHVDVAVIGGGVVGLACALEAASVVQSVCLVERHPHMGMETSTHNSGVIHAGIYYPAGSLKARLCVEGNARLYRFCEEHGVPHRRTGKIIVASESEEVPVLEALAARGRANGVSGLEIVDRQFIRAREPHIEATQALYSATTGIVEPESLVRTLRALCADRGVALLPGTPLTGGAFGNGRFVLETPQERFGASIAVNAAGLFADDVSDRLGGERFRIYPCRGEYAELIPSRRHLVKGPVYPLPDPSGHGLGVHLTTTIGGSVTLGPTIGYQERKDDYEDRRLPLDYFYEHAVRMLPELRLEDLRPGGSGIRAKLHPPEESFADFLIRPDAGVPRLIQVAGIDSPGLTACLAIGREVAGILLGLRD